MPDTDLSLSLGGAEGGRATYARLRVERLGIDTRIVEGTDRKSLALGPGHMTGTADPGEDGNCILAGHRDGVFGRLHEMRVGDLLNLEGAAGGAAYRVSSIRVVDRSDARLLAAASTPVLTLITCHPLRHAGPAPQRLVVRADRVGCGAPAGSDRTGRSAS